MSQKLSCDQVENGNLAERYVSGSLDEAEQQAYEQHYFACDRCFEDLERYQSLRTALADRSGSEVEHAVQRSRRLGWAWIAAAAVIPITILVVTRISVGPPAEPRVAEGPLRAEEPVPEEAGPSETELKLAELAGFEPPRFSPLALRSVPDPATQRFREGMRFYQQANYRAARERLQAAAELNGRAPNSLFFLAVCDLLLNDTQAAVGTFERTISLGESAYLESAHYYLAKAHLKRGELAPAAARLEELLSLDGDQFPEAGGLLDEVNALRASIDQRQ